MSKTTSMEYEKVIDYIDELIKNGDLCIGTKLPTERVIAEHLGIGRNSTREALSILHGMGMIRRVQGSGNYVTGDALHHDAGTGDDHQERRLRIPARAGEVGLYAPCDKDHFSRGTTAV